MEVLLLGHLAATAFMSGVIWVVQLVHYPLFDHVERVRFAAFETEHQRRIGWIVAPAMLLEAITALLLLVGAWRLDQTAILLLAVINLTLLAAIWAATGWLAVPQHMRLARGFDEETWGRLVRHNWIRTAAWSARLVILIVAALLV